LAINKKTKTKVVLKPMIHIMYY